MKRLHKTALRILDFLTEHQNTFLSFQDIANALSFSSRNLVKHHIDNLIYKKFILKEKSEFGKRKCIYKILINEIDVFKSLEKRISTLEKIIKNSEAYEIYKLKKLITKQEKL